MDSMIPDTKTQLLYDIQTRYTTISWMMGKLYDSAGNGRHVKDINSGVRRRLIDLYQLASFNNKFHEDTCEKMEKYMHGDKRKVLFSAQAKETIRMWELISKALRESRLIDL